MSNDNGWRDDGPLPPSAPAGAIPVTWKSGSTQLPGKSLVMAPTPDQTAVFSQTRVKTCGSCKHFHHNHGQKVVNKFMALVVLEAKWKREFICEDPDKLARCGMNSEVMVGPNSAACDQWKERR